MQSPFGNRRIRYAHPCIAVRMRAADVWTAYGFISRASETNLLMADRWKVANALCKCRTMYVRRKAVVGSYGQKLVPQKNI